MMNVETNLKAMELINYLPVYTNETFLLMKKEYDQLSNLGSPDEWYYESFEKSFNYWNEIKLLMNENKFERILELINEIYGDYIKELIIDKNYKDEENTSAIRYLSNTFLTLELKTLIFEKINMIMTLVEENENNYEDEQFEFDPEVYEFYKKMDQFYKQLCF